jgi:hypothetical protein
MEATIAPDLSGIIITWLAILTAVVALMGATIIAILTTDIEDRWGEDHKK